MVSPEMVMLSVFITPWTKPTAIHDATSAASQGLYIGDKLETAEIYIREANASKMGANAFARLEEYRNRKSVSSSVPRTANETKMEK